MGFADHFFEHEKFVVLDGAFATELERLGLNIKDPLWSALALIDKDELIDKVHSSYLEAGSDIITTASYQASIKGFMTKCLTAEQAAFLLRKSVVLAKQARDRFIGSSLFKNSGRQKPLVAASIGPYGAFLADGSEYRGRYRQTIAEIQAFHQERLAVIAQETPDLYALETVPQLSEALIVAKLLEELQPKAHMWVAFSCLNENCIADGTPVIECIKALNHLENVFAVGFNCTQPQFIESLVKLLRKNTLKKIIVYPNSGETYNPLSKTWNGNSDEFISNVLKWYQAGANLIGGCCRTTPKDIAKIAKLARS